MGQPCRWLFGDALTHEADLRELLEPGSHPPLETVTLGLSSIVPRWRSHVTENRVPPLRISVVGVRDWWIGGPDDNATQLSADGYERWRALYGRRTRGSTETLP